MKSLNEQVKNRDGKRHFHVLNERLAAKGIDWKYHFEFLSPEDYVDFFATVREGQYANWKSRLMQALET